MHTSKRPRAVWFGVAICAIIVVQGCGRKETAPPSEGSENLLAAPGVKPIEATPEQQTEQKLDPLIKADVELYLKVMRTAAERLKNPTPDDKATREAAKRILAGGSSRHVPTPDDAKTLERETLLATAMDRSTMGGLQ